MYLICITITTDASFCHHTKASGWAFRIKSNKFDINRSGNFKRTVRSADDAETYCIINALFTLLKTMRENNAKAKYIIVNTDSTVSIGRMNWTYKGLKKHKNKNLGKAINILKKIRNKCQVLEFRHVKAHSGIENKRSYANEWCDREAKIKMRQERKIINQKTNAKIHE